MTLIERSALILFGLGALLLSTLIGYRVVELVAGLAAIL